MTTAQIKAPVEAKVWAGTAGSGVGAALSAVILWALGVGFWGAVGDAAHATDAVAAVPFPVAAVVGLGVTGAVTFGAAWWAKHTPRLIELAGAVAADGYLPAHAGEPETGQGYIFNQNIYTPHDTPTLNGDAP